MKKNTRRFISSFTAGLIAAASLVTPVLAESTAEAPAAAESTAEAVTEPFSYYPWLNSNIQGLVTEDTETNVKDDFYLAANKDWLTSVEIPQGYATVSSFVELSTELDRKLLALMTDESLKSHDAELLQNFYELFLDWDMRNELGIEPLKPHIEAIEKISSIDELTAYVTSDEGLYYGGYLWVIYNGVDMEDSSRYDLEINSINLSLGDSAEYEKMTPNGELTQKAYNESTSYLLKKAGYTEEEVQAKIDASYDFEKKMAPSIMTRAEMHAPDSITKTTNPMTFDELKEMCPVFPLPEILEALDSADWEKINVAEPAWIRAMNDLYTEENLEGMKAYILINMLSGYSSFMDEETFRELQRISNERSGAASSFSDEMTAYQLAKSLFPVSISKVFVEKYMTEEIREDVRSIIGDVISAYREMLAEEDWLSEETRKAAVNKLDNLKIHAAYPDKWKDTESIQFSGKEEGGTLFDVCEELNRYEIEDIVSHKNTKVDPEIWDFSLAAVNAYYYPQNNSINIIAGILGEPFYSPDMSTEEKLGSIGMVIGHEISHAFDTTGSQFDADGNLANWWQPEDFEAFKLRAQKLIDYYDKIRPLEGVTYSGQYVQTEAIADMGGAKCMLRIAKGMENFDYDAFFRAFAGIWRRESSQNYEQMLMAQDTHPLAYLRGNVTLGQFQEFIDTYGIEEGDGMYVAPEDRICVW